MKSPASLALLPLVLLAACSAGDFAVAPATTASSAASLHYHAYGDSITAGALLTSPSTQAYPALLASAKTLSLTDLAFSGDQACDLANRQIFPSSEAPSESTPILYSVLIGTNDVDVKGAGAYQSTFTLCHQAALAWLALPSQLKILGTDPSVGTTGPTHIETSNNWNALVTDAAGAAVTFTPTRATAGALYVWYRIGDGSPGTFTYSLDGAVLGTLSASPVPAISTQNGTTSSLALLRIPSVPAGTHALTLTQTSAGVNGMGIVAIGTPPSTSFSTLPRVLVGTIPPQGNGYSIEACSPDNTPCAVYTANIVADMNLLIGDNLNLQLFDTHKYMSGTVADLADGIHPNVLGHQEIAHAIADIY